MILNNPFHILGLAANCGKRAEARRESQIKRYLEVGKPLIFENDLYFPGCRRNEITANRALTVIQDGRSRIGPGLFWFTQGGKTDDKCLNLLHEGDWRGALAIWQQFEDSSIAIRYASGISNFGTLALLIALVDRPSRQAGAISRAGQQDYLLRGLRAKARLIGGLPGADLSSFCTLFSDEIAVRDSDEITAIFAESLELFKAEVESHGLELPVQTLLSVLNSCGARGEAVRHRFARGPRQELERAVRQCASAYKNDPSKALAAGQQLMQIARVQLAELADIISRDDFAYSSLADRIANELQDAARDYHNHHARRGGANSRVINESLAIVNFAADVACGVATQTNVQDNLEALKAIKAEQQRDKVLKQVRSALNEWIGRAQDQLDAKTGPRPKIAFVQRAIGKSTSRKDSVINLLSALRDRGVRAFGPEFRSDEEMVAGSSAICTALTAILVSAYNGSQDESMARKAAESILAVDELFDVDGAGNDSFPISHQCAEFLARNVKGARDHFVTAQLQEYTRQQRRQSSNSGCSNSIVILAAVIAVLALIASGPGL
ncbi:MAG: hypothetical protein OXM02_15055 [Bacteroidota bacterium]|nr:hypothetical protein [Bacteroidota bacterium]